jgi:hypothetical protein
MGGIASVVMVSVHHSRSSVVNSGEVWPLKDDRKTSEEELAVLDTVAALWFT